MRLALVYAQWADCMGFEHDELTPIRDQLISLHNFQTCQAKVFYGDEVLQAMLTPYSRGNNNGDAANDDDNDDANNDDNDEDEGADNDGHDGEPDQDEDDDDVDPCRTPLHEYNESDNINDNDDEVKIDENWQQLNSFVVSRLAAECTALTYTSAGTQQHS